MRGGRDGAEIGYPQRPLRVLCAKPSFMGAEHGIIFSWAIYYFDFVTKCEHALRLDCQGAPSLWHCREGCLACPTVSFLRRVHRCLDLVSFARSGAFPLTSITPMPSPPHFASAFYALGAVACWGVSDFLGGNTAKRFNSFFLTINFSPFFKKVKNLCLPSRL